VPEGAIMTGGTVSLEIDLLVDTWFTDAPVLPALDLPGAVVSPPTGEAQHLNQDIDGKRFFGLRYSYRITPQAARHFDIPALAFQVQPGPASGRSRSAASHWRSRPRAPVATPTARSRWRRN
jgi:hypothetical protein